MCRVEEKILEWLQKHLLWIALAAVTAAGAWIRYDVRNFVSTDCIAYLFPWYDTIKENGGLFGGLDMQVGSYNLLFQFILALMTYLPVNSLHCYKLLSVLFDFLLAVFVAWWVYDLTGRENKWKGALAYAMVLCSPVVILNSSVWAQCDVIYTFFIVLALAAFMKERYAAAFLALGISLAFKLQAVFILPFFLFGYFQKKKFSFLYFLILPGVLFLSGLPGVILGGRGIFDAFEVYFGQTDWFPMLFMNYPSFWTLVCSNTYVGYENLKTVAMIFTVVALGALMAGWYVKRVRLTYKNMLYMAFILFYTCVLFLPGMHERYGFGYEILAMVIVFVNRRTILPLLALLFLSISTYGSYLFGNTINLTVLAVVNLITYAVYLLMLMQDRDCEEVGL